MRTKQIWKQHVVIVGLAMLHSHAVAASGVLSISGFTPSSGPPGTLVTITGNEMGSVREVDFINGKNAPYTFVDSHTLTTKVPIGALTGAVTLVGTKSTVVSVTPFTVTAGIGNGFIDPPHIPEPAGAMAGHPRLWMTSTDVSNYRTWATANNPLWVDLNAVAITAKQNMDNNLVPQKDSGQGNTNYEPYPTEQYAELFAFLSQVDPNVANRANYAQRAHDLLMFMINNAAPGLAPDGTPWRDQYFSVYNRSRWFGEAYPLVVDWCYSTFSTAEKATIRKVFLRWIQENLKAQVTGIGDHPSPIGVINNPILNPNPATNRWASDNYYCNHARQVGMLAMALDASDDIPTIAGDPPANTLRDFIGNAIGAWLYTVDACENASTKGGISPEGIGYGESDTSGIAMLLLAMKTAKVDVPASYGPQAAMATGNFWNKDFPDGYIHSMSPQMLVQQNWIGPSHLPADFGDNGTYGPANYIRTFGPLALIARMNGDTTTFNKLRWMIDEFEPGHTASRDYQITSCLSSYGALYPILYFMACDPTKGAGTDPHPLMPTDYIAPGLNRILSRTDWSPSASWFAYKCSWDSSDHGQPDANKIEFYRKGEWLTKMRMGYGFEVGCTDFQNTMCIQNTASNAQGFWGLQNSRGAQYSFNATANPVVVSCFGQGYTYAQGDATNNYNLAAIGATDVAHASRSVMWLKPDTIVVYDRADSKTAGKFKRFYLNTPKVASVNGKIATMTMASGQQLLVQSMLPAGATITSASLPPSPNGPDLNETAQQETMICRMMIEDATNPQSARFLTVLNGADPGTPAPQAASLKSMSGDSFDGAIIGSTVVMFKTDITSGFTTTTFQIPSTVTTIYVTGLMPIGNYAVTVNTANGISTIVVTPGQGKSADAGGVLKI